MKEGETSLLGMSEYAYNKRATFDYNILERFEVGLVLSGQEVKSVKQKHMSLKGAYAAIIGNEGWLINAHISPYKMAGDNSSYDPTRSRKLLMHRREIDYLIGASHQKGLTLIPIRVYSKRGFVKLELGLAKSKKQFDKRESIASRDAKKNIDRAIRGKN